MKTFYLGTHMPNWAERTDKPLFISHRRLRDRRTLPHTLGPAGIDSGGFTELSMYGEWRTTPREYVPAIARYVAEMNVAFAAPMDWMCEPWIIAKTGLTVREHQRQTVENFLQLTEMWPEYSDSRCPFIPVLQGWDLTDYIACWAMYQAAGVKLNDYPRVGLGSVCRRQATGEIGYIVSTLRQEDPGLRLHGFGVKVAGLAAYGHLLSSADSMAWSFRARRLPPLPGCTHASCANCLTFALAWRQRVLAAVEGPRQLDLFYRDEDAVAALTDPIAELGGVA